MVLASYSCTEANRSVPMENACKLSDGLCPRGQIWCPQRYASEDTERAELLTAEMRRARSDDCQGEGRDESQLEEYLFER